MEWFPQESCFGDVLSGAFWMWVTARLWQLWCTEKISFSLFSLRLEALNKKKSHHRCMRATCEKLYLTGSRPGTVRKMICGNLNWSSSNEIIVWRCLNCHVKKSFSSWYAFLHVCGWLVSNTSFHFQPVSKETMMRLSHACYFAAHNHSVMFQCCLKYLFWIVAFDALSFS